MFAREAREIFAWLDDLPLSSLSPILNLGSGSQHDGKGERPWPHTYLFAPLAARGVKVVHLDLAPGRGVDIAADILSDEGRQAARAVEPKLILLCNLLEHVTDPRGVVASCGEILPSGGFTLYSGPLSYPEHHCPIDNGLRPTPEEVAAMAPWATVRRSAILPTEYHWHEIARNPRKLMARKLKWLFTPYLVSMALLERR
jgi:hypothetical protein